ncbi:MAG TPA: BON domain-containing protein, partial [Pyrinomonadaceae bacterium]
GRDYGADAYGGRVEERDYVRDYGRDYDQDYGRGYGRGFERDDDARYGRERYYGESTGTRGGRGYGFGYARDYGGDYGRGYDRGYESGYEGEDDRDYGRDAERDRARGTQTDYGRTSSRFFGRGGGEYEGRYARGYDEDDDEERGARRYDDDDERREGRGGRGWLDRVSDEVASWFGDREAVRRRRLDEKRARRRGRGPKGYRRSDARIGEDINDRLSDQDYLDASEVVVVVNGGEVTLDGTVETRYDKRLAEDIAESVYGVTHVQNNLRVEYRPAPARADETTIVASRRPATTTNAPTIETATETPTPTPGAATGATTGATTNVPDTGGMSSSAASGTGRG